MIPPPNKDLSLVELPLRNLYTRAQTLIERIPQTGLGVVIVEGLRSSERQDALYAQGRTVPGEKVTWSRRSSHETGKALDIGLTLNGDFLVGRTASDVELYRLFCYMLQREAPAGVHNLGLRLGRDYFHWQAWDPFTSEQVQR